MKTQKEVENQNVKTNMTKRIEMFTNDIKAKEELFEKTGSQRHKNAANNLRARRGELQFVSKVWF